MSQTRSQAMLLRFARKSSAVVIVLSIVILAGGILDLQWQISWFSRWIVVNPLSAILLLLSGIALRRGTARKTEPEASRIDWIWLVCSIAVTLGGLFKLGEYAFGVDLDFDQRWFGGRPAPVGTYPSHEIAPNSALNFLFCGVGLLLLDVKTRREFCPAQPCFMLAAFVSLLALIGYAYQVLPLYSLGSANPMAFSAALAFELLSLAGMAARPHCGAMKVITSDTTAGATARRLLPAAILIPLVLGALRYSGERYGWFRADFGVSLFALANMLLFTVLIWWNSRLLYGAELERSRAERKLAVQYGATRVLAESPDISQATGKIVQNICERLGWQVGGLWRVDEKSRLIRCETLYVTSPDLAEFADVSRKLSFSVGTGLPGSVWEKREPIWIEDIQTSPHFCRSMAASRAGLRSVIGFPVRYNGTVCGVMEFLSAQAEPRDEALLQTLSAVGSQIGQFVERKQAHEQLRQSSSDLERSNTELQQFAYVASHDLSEPLRMIVSYLQLLVDRHRPHLNGEAQEFIGQAVDGARRMQAMIQDLLAYARVDSRGREFEAVNCEGVLNAAVQNLKVAIEETGAVVEHGQLPAVTGDAIQLTQVFQNLISNAIKFRGSSTPRIEIHAKKEGGEWVFTVADNGIGIAPRDFERVFVLFQRLHTRREYPGTGIGLAICKKIVDRHGGRIWLESEPGKGTTFFFTLPA